METKQSADRPVLSVNQLSKIFPARPGLFGHSGKKILAVDRVRFSIHRHETLGLVGESGSGKSTTGYLTLLLERPTSGSVWLNGTELTRLSSSGLRKLRPQMQIIFQNPYLSFNPRRTLRFLLREALQQNTAEPSHNVEERLASLMQQVGLSPDLLDRYPRQLSGGQQQRMAIARALATHPVYLVLDEPLSALDLLTQESILELLQKLQADLGLAYLFISHDLRVAREFCDRILVMYGGQIVEEWDADRLFAQPLHPYSQFLVEHIRLHPETEPTPEEEKRFPPVPQDPDRTGCVYQNRCPFAKPECREGSVPLLDAGAGHRVRCLFAGSAE